MKKARQRQFFLIVSRPAGSSAPCVGSWVFSTAARGTRKKVNPKPGQSYMPPPGR